MFFFFSFRLFHYFRNLHLWRRPSGLDDIHQVQRVAFSTTKKDFEGVEAPHETGVRLEGLEDLGLT